MKLPDWAPADVDVNQPSPARIYDYALGGSHNFAVDRVVAKRMTDAMPDIPLVARTNRSFLRRVVRFLTDAGIQQFLDLGSGIPTVGNVHEVAQQAVPEARVVYVDVDPIAVTHSTMILADNPYAAAIQADVRDPDLILTDPTVRSLINFTEPVGVLALSVMHYVPDQDHAREIVRKFRDAICPGSYLAISHAAAAGETRDQVEDVRQVLSHSKIGMTPRLDTEVAQFFEGFRIVEPGVVFAPQWRPDSVDEFPYEDPRRSATFAAVGVKL